MKSTRWLAVVGCLALLAGCQALGKALDEGGPKFKAKSRPTETATAFTLTRLAKQVQRLESEQMKLERDQADLERQRDTLQQLVAA